MKFLILNIFLFLTMVLITGAQSPDSVKYKSLDPYYFHLQYLKEDPALLIDVRQFFEYRRNRIKDAINISSSRDLLLAADTISGETAFFLYCSTDFRSRAAAELLYKKGFRKLYNLEGGIVAWKKDGFPVEKGKVKKIRRQNN